MTLTVGSLFSGIGGLDLGLERAGMEIRWQVEIDPFCCKVLEKHWPEVKRYGDIRKLDGSELEPVDLICGGFPCQPHSVAGKRKASADERDLWPEFARIIREVKPRWVMGENVSGLRSSERGRFFGIVLRDLAQMGFDAQWGSVCASDVGALHRRERVFIVGYSGGRRCSRYDRGRSREKFENGRATLSNTHRRRREQSNTQEWSLPKPDASSDVSDADSSGCEEQCWTEPIFTPLPTAERGCWWESEPDVGRVAHGVPSRVDRLKSLGNAVVPQVAEWIARRILEVSHG